MATAEDDPVLRRHLPNTTYWGRLEMQEAHLRPGDLLFVPSLWFHTTEAIGTTQSLGFSFWSTNMEMLEITIEKEQSKECRTQLEGLATRKPPQKPPPMLKLKAMLFASILRVLDAAYDIDEVRRSIVLLSYKCESFYNIITIFVSSKLSEAAVFLCMP